MADTDKLNDKLTMISQPMIDALSNVLPMIEGLAISDRAAYLNAVALLSDLKEIAKSAEAARKEITQPLVEQQRATNAFFREQLTDRIEKCEASLKRGIADYERAERKRKEAAQKAADLKAERERKRLERRAFKAAEKGDMETAAELRESAASGVAEVVTSESRPKGVSIRESWKFEVTDPAKVPRQYLMIDEKKIRGVVNALKGDTEIPGVRVYRDDIVASTGR